MNQRSLAISILQKARDTLCERLTQRVVESQAEIEADAEGYSYLSEIETLYEQLGGRLAHLNAMLSNLPPMDHTATADVTASEIIYADLASAYPSGLELEASTPVTLLALPAPNACEEPPLEPLAQSFAAIVLAARTGDLAQARRLISEVFDIKPSHAQRSAQALERQLEKFPELAGKIEQLGQSLAQTNDYAAATLLGECFEFQAIEAFALVQSLKLRLADPDAAQ